MRTLPPRPPVAAPDPSNRAPEFPSAEHPELKLKCPLTPLVPLFTLCSTTCPLLFPVPSPDAITIMPPVFTILRPAASEIDPPEPLLPLPTEMTIPPLRPVVAAALPMRIVPVLPPQAEPELKTSAPLVPWAPELAVWITMVPLLVCVPSPLAKESPPPLAAVLRPDLKCN